MLRYWISRIIIFIQHWDKTQNINHLWNYVEAVLNDFRARYTIVKVNFKSDDVVNSLCKYNKFLYLMCLHF